MLVKKHKSEVVSIKNLLEGIYTIEFKSLGRKYKYYPGQFLHLAIDGDYDGVGQWPESRCFSMQSSPDEKNIRITYAVKGHFTSLMRDSLKVGGEVWLKLPYGDLYQQPHNKENTVFIAGGTGITPFLSLFTYSGFKQYKNPVLFLGLRAKKYNFYTKELEIAKEINPSLSYFNYCDDDNGRPDIKSILKKKGNTFFISGPPEMLTFYKNKLIKNGIKHNQIITDDWEQ